MIGIAAALAAVATAASYGAGGVKTQEVEYAQGSTTLQGYFAAPERAKGKRPGVLVVHEWWGHNDHARRQAERLAREGYVAFALDMYGKGKVATHPKDATAFMEQVTKDPQLLTARFDAALEALRRHEQVDPERIAAVGYCMGGTIALAMARAGKDLDAVGTFHAGLAPPAGPAEKGRVKARILVQTGGQDPMIPPEQVKAFREEMKAAGAKAEVVTYPQAKHSFTNPDASKAGLPALAYDPKADRESFKRLARFLREVFGG